MGHMGDGLHFHSKARARSRCQNLRLPYIFLISELNPFPAVDKYICFGVFALYARVPEQLVHLRSLCSTYKLCA